ncbi:glucosamine-6-phosphate deaminase [Micrococcales bacterium 31B]|nr:glucosamine-6-phosphate deaminase [Micrococcales bacterium 31B]
MEVIVQPDAAACAKLGADAIAGLVTRHPSAVLGLATGSSPLGIYDELIARYKAGAVSFAEVTTFSLDEYVGLPREHYESYHSVIRRVFTDQIDIDPARVHGPDGEATEIAAECARYETAIRSAGGVDLQILGIGTTGHIGFNEPGSSLASRTRLKTLTPRTREDNARFFDSIDDVPMHVLTQGIGTIMDARHLLLVATGEAKADAVRELVEGAVSARWPCTIMQHHPHVTVLLDEAAAAKLDLAEYYAYTYAKKPAWQTL